MTMHLIRGMSSLNTRKPKSKAVDMAKMEVEWRQHNKDLRRKGMNWAQFSTLQDYVDYRLGKTKAKKREFEPYEPTKTYRRETETYASLSESSMVGNATKKESPKYTGDYLIGIATMHKSNLVPVSRGDDPTAYATMRRG